MVTQCALHLRQYNDALLINDTVRMEDAFKVLDEFYSSKVASRTGLDGTDIYLFSLFQGKGTPDLTLKILCINGRLVLGRQFAQC